MTMMEVQGPLVVASRTLRTTQKKKWLVVAEKPTMLVMNEIVKA
jgi:hypothetical protein